MLRMDWISLAKKARVERRGTGRGRSESKQKITYKSVRNNYPIAFPSTKINQPNFSFAKGESHFCFGSLLDPHNFTLGGLRSDPRVWVDRPTHPTPLSHKLRPLLRYLQTPLPCLGLELQGVAPCRAVVTASPSVR
jgi:hypothetical protein